MFTPKGRLLAALKLKGIDRVPAAFPYQTGTIQLMEAAGAHWPQAHRDPKKMAQLAWSGHEIAEIESVRVPFDVVVEPEAVGCKISEGTLDVQPTVIKHIDLNNLNKLHVPDPEREKRMPVVIEATRLLKEKCGKNIPILACISTPSLLAFNIRGLDYALLDLMEQTKKFSDLMSFCLEVEKVYGTALKEAGADVLVLLDNSADLLRIDLFRKYSFPYIQNLAKELRCPTIIHICGQNENNILDASKLMKTTEIDGIAPAQCVNLNKAVGAVEGKKAIVGNVDPKILCERNPDEVSSESIKCIKMGTSVLSPGCGLSPHTPTRNIISLVKTATNYRL